MKNANFSKKMINKFAAIIIMILGVFFISQKADAAISETINLNSGWNIVSTPRLLDSHVFSAAETSANFDIYILNASSTAGWSTMSELGQTEFKPLFGYFINNKTGTSQTLTFNYRGAPTPPERLFERVFTRPGWYSIGVANPTTVKTRTAPAVNSGNVTSTLDYLTRFFVPIIDFTASDYPATPSSVRVGATWTYAYSGNLNALNDLRETKGYAVYVSSTAARYSGFQNIDAGRLQVTNMPLVSSASVVRGVTGTIFALAQLSGEVVTSEEPVNVSSITMTDAMTNGAAANDLNNLVLRDGSGNLLNATTTKINATTTKFNLLQNITVPKTGSVLVLLVGDVTATSTLGTHNFKISTSSSITAVGASSTAAVSPTVVGSGQAVAIIGSGSASLTALPGSNMPSSNQTVVVGETNVPVLSFSIGATGEPVKFTSLSLVANGTNRPNDIGNVKLFLEGSGTPFATIPVGIASSSNALTFTATNINNILPSAVQPGSPMNVIVKADVGIAGGAVLGNGFSFSLNGTSISARGSNSNNTTTPSGNVTATGISYITPFTVLSVGDAPLGGTVMDNVINGYHVARVSITNNGFTTSTITRLKFTDLGTHVGSSTSYALFYSDQGATNFVANFAGTNAPENLDFINLNVPINAGQMRYFTLLINNIGSMVTGNTIEMSISNLGDVSYVVSEQDLGYDSNASGNLVGNSSPLFARGNPIFASIWKF